MADRNTPTPTSDTAALMMALIVTSDLGEMTVRLFAQMYPSPISITN